MCCLILMSLLYGLHGVFLMSQKCGKQNTIIVNTREIELQIWVFEDEILLFNKLSKFYHK